MIVVVSTLSIVQCFVFEPNGYCLLLCLFFFCDINSIVSVHICILVSNNHLFSRYFVLDLIQLGCYMEYTLGYL